MEGIDFRHHVDQPEPRPESPVHAFQESGNLGFEGPAGEVDESVVRVHLVHDFPLHLPGAAVVDAEDGENLPIDVLIVRLEFVEEVGDARVDAADAPFFRDPDGDDGLVG